MIPRELIGTAEVPGGEPLRLFRRGRDFMIVLDRNELMNSRMSGSEEALAEMTCERLAGRKAAHLLIGGYGMGFTLRAALARLGRDARITVAELVPGIIEWARGPMAELTAGCLDDRRVRIAEGDVAALIAAGRGEYDAILLDVDNGPDGLTRPGNDRLYGAEGLEAAKTALRPQGVLAVWSAAPDAAFARRLKQAGFAVDEVAVRARANGKGPRHVIWLATKGGIRGAGGRTEGNRRPAKSA
jgi:spermidine synthase